MAGAAPAEAVWKYLSPSDPLASADFIVGFGHFDQRIAEHCAALYAKGLAPKVIFTGGAGSGSAGLAKTEAEHFRDTALQLGVPLDDIILETKSTNTPENVKMSLAVLAGLGHVSVEADRFILVATPYRQRRVQLTCRRLLPRATLLNSVPDSAYCHDLEVFAQVGESLDRLLVGEVDRIKKYGDKGDIESTHVPADIEQAMAQLSDIVSG
mmetsp:Transcript_722/g.1596  ORF Transcript_722/g.1596 Transcript_722/m.1596 type:complete len:211 (-) Transcript_722:244-876(-)